MLCCKSEKFLNACESNNIDLVKILLQHPDVDPGYGFNKAITVEYTNGYIEIVSLLLQDNRVNPSEVNSWAIQNSVENEHLEIVKLLLKNKYVGFYGQALIMLSAENNNFPITTLLINNTKFRPNLRTIKYFL